MDPFSLFVGLTIGAMGIGALIFLSIVGVLRILREWRRERDFAEAIEQDDGDNDDGEFPRLA